MEIIIDIFVVMISCLCIVDVSDLVENGWSLNSWFRKLNWLTSKFFTWLTGLESCNFNFVSHRSSLRSMFFFLLFFGFCWDFSYFYGCGCLCVYICNPLPNTHVRGIASYPRFRLQLLEPFYHRFPKITYSLCSLGLCALSLTRQPRRAESPLPPPEIIHRSVIFDPPQMFAYSRQKLRSKRPKYKIKKTNLPPCVYRLATPLFRFWACCGNSNKPLSLFFLSHELSLLNPLHLYCAKSISCSTVLVQNFHDSQGFFSSL